ncbi:MAG: hypothetical protein P8Z75_01530 [Gammaproteobacteria bacterium]|jgi:hypothetical protein
MSPFRIHQIVAVLGLAIMLSSAFRVAKAVPIVQDRLVIGASSIEYHGKRVSIPLTRKELIHVFGQPSRKVYDAAGNVLVWDDLGLSCFDCQKPNPKPEELEYMTPAEARAYKPNKRIGALMIYVSKYNPYGKRKRKYNHEPALPFPGEVRIQGVSLNGTTTIKQFIAQRNSKQTILLPNNSFSFYIRCKPTPQEITLYTIRDKYSDEYLNVYAVSIRNVGRFYKKLRCRENFEQQEKRRLELKKLEEENLSEPENMPKGPLPVPVGEGKGK